MVARSRGPLAPLLRAAHVLVLRAVAAWLRRAAPGSSAFVSGSFGDGRPLYGVSDMDLVVVTPDDAGAARGRVRARWAALCRRLPLLPRVIELAVLERGELARATSAPVFTYGLRRRDLPAAYLGREPLTEKGLLEGPGLHGPMAGWRPLGRAPSPPPAPAYDRQATRMVAWLQLQSWWRFAFRTCAGPPGPRSAFTCVKFVSEPVRILLWLTHGERVTDREAALQRGLELMPDEEPAIRAALDLHARLPASPAPPVAAMLPHLVRLSSRIAATLGRELDGGGWTDVALAGESGGHSLPLADWRALVWSWLPDELLIPDPGDPRDAAAIARSARRFRPNRQPVLRHDDLVVLPVADLEGGWGRLRAVQCELTDPVSFALLGGRRHARFPEVAGWSARDWARRAVAEHRAWLDSGPDSDDPPPLARPINAVRAALLESSVEEGSPLLPLTPAATLDELADREPALRTVAEEAAAAYRDWREGRRTPDPAVARALLAGVRRLDAYGDSTARATSLAGR
jgi:hypothetical protein